MNCRQMRKNVLKSTNKKRRKNNKCIEYTEFNVENLKGKKTTRVHKTQETDHYNRGEVQITNSEAMTSSSPSSDRRLQSYTLTLSLTVTEATNSF